MFDGRIYRAAFVPVLFMVVIVGFSLTGRPAPLGSTLAPDAFNGPRAFARLQALVRAYPERHAGSAADMRLAERVAGLIREAAGGAGGGFRVSLRGLQASTSDGRRVLSTVVAERPGSTGESPLVILAHRDAVRRGSQAELSGTAALIELARVFAHSQTRRTIVLVSTSGGSDGGAGAADFAAHAPSPLDAAIVLGDLAGANTRKPFVVGFSAGSGAAPDALARTVAGAISQEVGVDPGEPSLGAQLAHLALPLATAEQAPLDRAGIPAVLVQVDGGRDPSAREPVSAARLQNFGRAVLGAVYALDEGPDIKRDLGARLVLGRETLPSWAVRLLALALLVPPLLVCIDALARMRRRREPVGRWLVWAASCAAPFLTAAAFVVLLGRLGILTAPAGQPSSAALADNGSGWAALAAAALVLALALAAWPALARRLALPPRPSAEGAGVAAMLVLLGVCLLVWLANPFACLLLVPAAHLWLLACIPGERRRALAGTAILLGVAPVALVAVVYARELALGPTALAQSALLALAGDEVGPFAAVLWSAALGCLLAMLLLLRAPEDGAGAQQDEWVEITTRGPLSYAGPGSLGGTESALRR